VLFCVFHSFLTLNMPAIGEKTKLGWQQFLGGLDQRPVCATCESPIGQYDEGVFASEVA
jgi:hypothetical protein